MYFRLQIRLQKFKLWPKLANENTLIINHLPNSCLQVCLHKLKLKENHDHHPTKI